MKISENKIEFFTALYDRAVKLRGEPYDSMERWYRQYRGDKGLSKGRGAEIVRNITYELIESQVSSEIPVPRVSTICWSEENERLARRTELLLKAIRDSLPIEKLNDIDERYTYIYGGSVFLVEWDENAGGRAERGGVKITVLNPECFIPQPGVFDVEDMEYCFIRYKTPMSEIARRWNIDECSVFSACESADEGCAFVNVCFYKNEKGYVSVYVFSGQAELADIDDYYSRKKRCCLKCGKNTCECVCESPEYVLVSSDAGYLTRDIVKSDGSVIPAGSALPWYRPKRFPIVVRKNTSLDKSVFGQSDCEFIKDQQEEINRVLSRVHEKLMMAGVYPYKPEECSFRYDNSIGGKVLNLSRADSADSFGILDTTPDISRDLEYIEKTYNAAKRILGISDTYQGVSDKSTQSGKAMEIEISRASGRLESKRAMKCAAYADIDRIIFSLMLAFADSKKSLRRKDSFGRIHNESFSRYDFIAADPVSGRLFYNDSFVFSAFNEKQGESRKDAWERNLENYKAGVFGKVGENETLLRYWQAQERAHYPGAKENTEYFMLKQNKE